MKFSVNFDDNDGAKLEEKKMRTKKTETKTSPYVMTTCSKCGNLIPHGQYCTDCGSPLPHVTLLKLTMTCKACGGTSAKGAFCSRCGSPQNADV